jgi:hypothetical protein
VKLTSLQLHWLEEFEAAEQLQHISSLTALQELSVENSVVGPGNIDADDLSGIKHLSRLTSLELQSYGLDFDTSCISSWGALTGLQQLSLSDCVIQTEALAALTQLRALSLWYNYQAASVGPLLRVVSQLSLLTELTWHHPCISSVEEIVTPVAPPATAFSALTASTNLCSLNISFWPDHVVHGMVIFHPGRVYPHLRELSWRWDTTWVGERSPMTISHIQNLCDACPALESLTVVPSKSAAAFLALLQLSALTCLVINRVGAAAAVASLDITAQLTGLRKLALRGRRQANGPVVPLLQLTALTALEELEVTIMAKEFHFLNKIGVARIQSNNTVWLLGLLPLCKLAPG